MDKKLFKFKVKAEDNKKIKSVNELITKIEKKIEEDTKKNNNIEKRYYFRGQADFEWELVPSIARLDNIYYLGKHIEKDESKQKKQEINLFHRFRRHTYEYKGRLLDKWEALFLARHYELPVRLLDWSTNPLVALYNATFFEKEEELEEKKDGEKIRDIDGVVWYFTRKESDENDIDVCENKDPFAIPGVRLIYPFNPTPKITAQASVFTIHQHPWKDMREMKKKEYASNELDIEEGGCFIIPKNEKIKIQKSLYRLGVNSLTLHLDLHHIVIGLKQREVLPYLKDE